MSLIFCQIMYRKWNFKVRKFEVDQLTFRARAREKPLGGGFHPLAEIGLRNASVVLIKSFVAFAVGKIHKLQTAKLRELEEPWLTK